MVVTWSSFIYNRGMNIKPYQKIDGKWYRARCDDCNVLIQRIHQKLCKQCWMKSIKGNLSRVPSRLGSKHTPKSKLLISKAKLNGKKISYQGLHQRLYRTRGPAKACQNSSCLGKSQTFDWANYTGRYDSVDDFIQLCRSCHVRFDKGNLKVEIV